MADNDTIADYLSEFGDEPAEHLDLGFGQPGQQQEKKWSKWQQLSTMPTDITDAISDSESVVSIGDLGDVRGGDGYASDDGSSSDGEGSNSWEASLHFIAFSNCLSSPSSST